MTFLANDETRTINMRAVSLSPISSTNAIAENFTLPTLPVVNGRA
jgi:hypothetical protein